MNRRSLPVIEELGYSRTSMGEIVLRRRRSPSVKDEFVYEITLGGEMLMSSTVNTSERALATLTLDRLEERKAEVLVGGLGLGYTALAALEYSNVERVDVIELVQPVIDWHREKLFPAAAALADDRRCRLLQGDFFELASEETGRSYDAVLLDIDNAPDSLLHSQHGAFYEKEGLQKMSRLIKEGGVFGLWSACKPGDEFLKTLEEVFRSVNCQEIVFYNPHEGRMDSNRITTAFRN